RAAPRRRARAPRGARGRAFYAPRDAALGPRARARAAREVERAGAPRPDRGPRLYRDPRAARLVELPRRLRVARAAPDPADDHRLVLPRVLVERRRRRRRRVGAPLVRAPRLRRLEP